jgi:hypothetical protein
MWLQDIYNNTERVADLMQNELDQGSLPMVMNALKTGFISKSVEAVQWACQVFSKLALELSERDFLAEMWEWFGAENGAIDVSLMAANRHKAQVQDKFVEMLMHVSADNLLELFTLKLRNNYTDNAAYLELMHDFLLIVGESDVFVGELSSSGVLSYWVELGIKESD